METNESSSATPGYSAACSIEHFSSDALLPLIRETFPDEEARSRGFPAGVEYRKHWEVAMAVRAFRDHGALRPDSRILGVGAGMERTLFYLTHHAAEVVATDLYLGAGSWEGDAPLLMLVSPRSCTRFEFDPARLTVRHMDGRVLDIPDASFDGVFSSSSIEHFGNDDDIAAAAYEMGRVLRPGGVLTLATELLVMGPVGARGWPGCRLFTEPDLRRLVVEASGLELVGGLDLSVSPATLETPRDLAAIIRDRQAGRGLDLPHIVVVHEGQVFTSVQLTLRKTEAYPVSNNAWAAPSRSLRERVRREAEETAGTLIRALKMEAQGERGWTPAAVTTAWGGADGGLRLRDAFDAWDAVRARTALSVPATGPAWRRWLGFAKRTVGRVRDLGVLWDRERDLLRALLARLDEIESRLNDGSRKDDR